MNEQLNGLLAPAVMFGSFAILIIVGAFLGHYLGKLLLKMYGLIDGFHSEEPKAEKAKFLVSWDEVRKKGMFHYVLFTGVLKWGVQMCATFTTIAMLNEPSWTKAATHLVI